VIAPSGLIQSTAQTLVPVPAPVASTVVKVPSREAKMARKGEGKEAKLSCSGNLLVENRNGLIVTQWRGKRTGRRSAIRHC
jgi:hypothetical protein